MLQIFDEGRLTDGLGRLIDFRNTIIIMTSNVGSREVMQRGKSVGYNTTRKPTSDDRYIESLYRKNLERNFAPEFINRIDDIVTFGTLTEKDVLRIIDIELGSLNRRIADQGYMVEVNNATKRCLVREGYDPHYGVRSLKRV